MERLLGWGQSVVHIFDQGFASAFWLGVLLAFALRFVLGFRADYQLDDAQGNHSLAWRIAMGKRGWSERTIWDSRHARWVHESRARPAGDAPRPSGHTPVAGGLP